MHNRPKWLRRLLALGAAALLLTGCAPKAPQEFTPVEPAFVQPAPTPTPPPPSVITFAEDGERPLPDTDLHLLPGTACSVGGRVTSNYPLTEVRAVFTCYRSEDPFYPRETAVTFSPADNVLSYDLNDPVGEGPSLNARMNFGELMIGLHTLTLYASNTAEPKPVRIASCQFYVLDSEWETLSKKDFNGTYGLMKEFFGGDTDKFLFKYQRVWDRYVVVDPAWEQTYIKEIPGPGGDRLWKLHTDAIPHFEKAFAYLDSARVRVHGTNGDTGVLPLRDLVYTYNGSYVPRNISNSRYFSLHSFGTAVDLNVPLEPNQNKKENLAVIDEDVKGFLTYNGILEEAGQSYYDFTYTGSYALTENGVPQTCVNYLLYELAFYRAGFLWGHYYNSTSDAMHFTLTDDIKDKHFTKAGLGKVREYYD